MGDSFNGILIGHTDETRLKTQTLGLSRRRRRRRERSRSSRPYLIGI